MYPLDWLSSETIDLLIQGVKYTLWLTVITSVLSLGTGILIGVFRLSNRSYFNYPA